MRNRKRIRHKLMVGPVRGWLEEGLLQLQLNLERGSKMARLETLCWLARLEERKPGKFMDEL